MVLKLHTDKPACHLPCKGKCIWDGQGMFLITACFCIIKIGTKLKVPNLLWWECITLNRTADTQYWSEQEPSGSAKFELYSYEQPSTTRFKPLHKMQGKKIFSFQQDHWASGTVNDPEMSKEFRQCEHHTQESLVVKQPHTTIVVLLQSLPFINPYTLGGTPTYH